MTGSSKAAARGRVPPRATSPRLATGAPRGPAGGPGRLKGYHYIGPFPVRGAIVVADPCYVKETRQDLANRLRAKSGVWHAWVRHDPTSHYASIEVLTAAHEDHVALARDLWRRFAEVPPVGLNVWVDSGTVSIVDAARLDADAPFLRRVHDCTVKQALGDLLEGSGCVVTTPHGDGCFPLGVTTLRRAAVAVQVAFAFDDEDEAGEEDDE